MNEEEPESGIAVVGMAGRFPDAHDIGEFWELLLSGRSAIRSFDREELRRAGVPDELADRADYVPAGTVMPDADRFDAAFFGMTPGEARLTDPQQRVFLETCWTALEQAGIRPDAPGGRVGVFGSTTLSTYLFRNVLPDPLAGASGVLSYPVMVGNDKDFLATRVAYRLGLTGPALTVQSACSSSLVAVHLAVQSLLEGETDVALAGGVSVLFPQESGYPHNEGGPLSADGRCLVFDAHGTGTVKGNGCGVVVLRRLSDALADRDPVIAVINGTAVGNDGSDKVGFTAPSVSAQAAVIREALAFSGLKPDRIGYVEAHGTGTAMGDPIEVRALTKAYQPAGEPGSCLLGSVKGAVGHLDAAAGVTGLIKAALVLRHGIVPAQPGFTAPNPELRLEQTPFTVPRHAVARPLAAAAVSSFGMGGTNAHAVLTPAPAAAPRPGPPAGPYLIALSARDAEALGAQREALRAHLARHPELRIDDVARTLLTGRRRFAHRFACVADSTERLAALLATPDAAATPGVPGADTEPTAGAPGADTERAGVADDDTERAGVPVADGGPTAEAPAAEAGALAEVPAADGRPAAGVSAADAGVPGDVPAGVPGADAGASPAVPDDDAPRTASSATPLTAADDLAGDPPTGAAATGRSVPATAPHPGVLAWESGAEPAPEDCGDLRYAAKVPLPGHPLRRDRHWIEPPAADAPASPDAHRPDRIADRDVPAVVLGVLRARLGEGALGPDDDFYLAGGESLIAVEIVADLTERFGEGLSLSRFEELRTARRTAGHLLALRSPGAAAPDAEPVLVRIKDGDPERELFLFHPAGGTVFVYSDLARRLRLPGRIHALSFPAAEADTLVTVPGMADRYLAAIRAVRPHGPYRLGGYSLGGNIAFEAALRLRAEGEHVEPLLLIDALAPEAYAGVDSSEAAFCSFAPDLMLAGLGIDTPALRAEPAPSSIDGVLDRARQPEWSPHTLREYRRQLAVMFANQQALTDQSRRLAGSGVRFDGGAVLFEAAEPWPEVFGRMGMRPAGADGWRARLGGELRVVPVPGDHYTMVREHLGSLAAALESALLPPG